MARDVGALTLFETLAHSGLPLPVTQKRRLRSWLRDESQPELPLGVGIVFRRVNEIDEVIKRAMRYV